ncbi:histidine phosphatase family protein [Microbacteriaceae bacterium 4G12]
MRLLLIRHGQTPDNARGALGAMVPGPGLTELGREQAAAVPDALADESIDAIYVSTMVRTHETAAPLAQALGITPTELPGLREISAGSLEQRSDPDAIRLYMGTIFSWADDMGARIPDAESGHEFFARYDDAIAEIASRHDGTVAIFSHGAAIRTWASRACRNVGVEFSRVNHLENTAVVILEGSPGDGWVAQKWADAPLGGAQLEDATAADPTGEAG